MSTAKANAFDLHTLSAQLADALAADALALRLAVSHTAAGARIVDAGIETVGGFEAGVRIAEICMAGLGKVALAPTNGFEHWPWQVSVSTSQPVYACLGSQYAGWSLAVPRADGSGKTWNAMASGPARALAAREPLFAEAPFAALRARPSEAAAPRGVLVLETSSAPPDALIDKLVDACGVPATALTLVLTPTGSPAGCVQIAARVVEVALHKAHTLGFALNHVLEGLGTTPLPPPAADGLQAMGRTNDTILFGGRVHLFVDGPDDAAEALANDLPAGASRDYGKPFAQVFKDYDYDFFAIDPMLFSPAAVTVTAVGSGRSFHAGRLDPALLDRSFG